MMASNTKRSFLSVEEQIAAFHAWKAGEQRAAEKIYKSYEGFIVNIAWKYAKKAPNLEFEDLKNTAKMGFMEALDRYDPSKGASIGTYAESWMRYRLTEAIRLLSNTKHQSSNRLAKDIYMAVTKKLHEINGADMPLWKIFESVAKERGMKPDSVRRSYETSCLTTVSLNIPANEDYYERGDLIADEQADPADIIDYKKATETLYNAIDQLDERSGKIIRLRFGIAAKNSEPLVLADLSKEFGISRERVRQLEQNALQKLRRLLEDSGLKGHIPTLEAGQH